VLFFGKAIRHAGKAHKGPEGKLCDMTEICEKTATGLIFVPVRAKIFLVDRNARKSTQHSIGI
jgi:hypothetical protein